jgi:hypothetical protein
MTALALVGNYALVTIPNVELGTTILFLTAFTFGPYMAIWCTIIMSIIFSSLNPWGGMIPLIWLAQVIGWLYVSIAGGILGRSQTTNRVDLLVTGFITTLIFDISTTVAYSLSFSIPIFVAFMTGIWFIVVHVVSNTILFPIVIPTINNAIQGGLGNMIWESDDTILEIPVEETNDSDEICS